MQLAENRGSGIQAEEQQSQSGPAASGGERRSRAGERQKRTISPWRLPVATAAALAILLLLIGGSCSQSSTGRQTRLPEDENRDVKRKELLDTPDNSENDSENGGAETESDSGDAEEGEEEKEESSLSQYLRALLGIERPRPVSEQFNYETLLETEIVIQLKLYDLQGRGIADLARLSPKERRLYRSRGEQSGILTLQRAGSSRPSLTAAIRADGSYRGRVLIAPHQDGRWELRLHKRGYQSRSLTIRGLRQYLRIERDVYMATGEASAEVAVTARRESQRESEEAGGTTGSGAAGDGIIGGGAAEGRVAAESSAGGGSQAENDQRDSDGDGIPNIYDAFPTDPRRAFQIALPEADYLTVAYEDSYPRIADGDYNDYVVRYQVAEHRNADNQVVEISGVVEPVAMKSYFDHRFGIYIRFPGARGRLVIENSNHAGEIIRTRESEVEGAADLQIYERTQESISFVFTQNGRAVAHRYKYSYINNDRYREAELRGHRAYFSLRFDDPVEPDRLDKMPYDPYLSPRENGYDIHLAGREALPASRNPSTSDRFRAEEGSPWALLVPSYWLPPKEREDIESAYPDFIPWRESRGTERSDWYLRPDPGLIEPASLAVIEGPDFPESGPLEESYFESMDWSLQPGARLGACQAPELVNREGSDGTVRMTGPEQWQKFIYCHLNSDPYPLQTELGLNYTSFTEREDSAQYVASLYSQYLLSAPALEQTAEQSLERLYQAITFRDLSDADRAKISSALQEASHEEVALSLLSAWYNSPTFLEVYDYSRAPYVGRSWISIRGRVEDQDGSPIAGAPIRLRIIGQAASFAKTDTGSDGRYRLTRRMPNNRFSQEVTLRLNYSGYLKRDWIVPLQTGEMDYYHDYKTIQKGMADPAQGGEIRSGNRSVTIMIPPDAVDERQSFSVSNPELYSLGQGTGEGGEGDGEERQALRFTVTPDYEFSQEVMLQVALTSEQQEALQLQEGDEDIALFAEEAGELRMLIPSLYDPESGILKAPTDHFSIFVIASCGAALCHVGGSPHLPPSRRASLLFGPRQLRFPADLPAYQQEMKQTLNDYGWQDTSELVESLDSSQFCPQQPCYNMVIDLKDDANNIELFQGISLSRSFDLGDLLQEAIGGDIGRFFNRIFDGLFNLGGYSVRGGKTTLTSATAVVNADLVSQTEQCAINPLASSPQPRLNHIPALRASISTRYHATSIEAKWKEIKHCKISYRVPIGLRCSGWRCRIKYETHSFSWICGTQTRREHIPSADMVVNIDDLRFSYHPGDGSCNRISASGESWCLTQQSQGRVSVNITGGGSRYRSHHDQIVNQVIRKVKENEIDVIQEQVLTHIRDSFALQTYFDDSNCFASADRYRIRVNISGLNADDGEYLVLQNNGTDNLRIEANGLFRFSRSLAEGANYAVSIKEGQIGEDRYCSMERERGFVRGASIIVAINCVDQNLFGAAGGSHTCAIVDEAAWCWGSNRNGQLGIGASAGAHSSPQPVLGLGNGVAALSTGGSHTCAIHNGAAKCWGSNNGKLGDGTKFDRYSPVQVYGLAAGVTDISAGQSFTCAIQNGAAKCWGSNFYGQLGDGTQTNRSRPVQVAGLTSGVTEITTGFVHTCAIQYGAVKCWGRNFNSQLGDGTETDRLRPVQASGLNSGVTAITSGFSHNCAIHNQVVKCWGKNANGESGIWYRDINSSRNISTPQQISSYISDSPGQIVKMAAESTYTYYYPKFGISTCAIVAWSSIRCWSRTSPIESQERFYLLSPPFYEVLALTPLITDISMSDGKYCAVANHQLFCWRDGSGGQPSGGSFYPPDTEAIQFPEADADIVGGSSQAARREADRPRNIILAD